MAPEERMVDGRESLEEGVAGGSVLGWVTSCSLTWMVSVYKVSKQYT